MVFAIDTAAGAYGLLAAAADRIFRDAFGGLGWAADEAAWPDGGWRAIEDAGLLRALLSEADGGCGDIRAALEVVRLAGYHALPVPLADAMLANWLAARIGLALGAGLVTLAPPGATELQQIGNGACLSGRLAGVPYGRRAEAVIAVVRASEGLRLAVIPGAAFAWLNDSNLAGESRDRGVPNPSSTVLAWEADPSVAGLVEHAGAVARTAQMAGAAERALEMTLQHVTQRRQFGRPLSDFQAVQQIVAVMAGEAAACRAAVDLAADALATDDRALSHAAKAACGVAASRVVSLAHQAHGAMGFTQAYDLQRFSRRVWSWRDEFGGEADHELRLGRAVAANPPLWPFLTAMGARG